MKMKPCYCKVIYIAVFGTIVFGRTDQAQAQQGDVQVQSQHGGRHSSNIRASSDPIPPLPPRAGGRDKPRYPSALDRLPYVTTIDDFLTLLITDGRPVTSKDIYSQYASESGEKMIVGGGVLAVPDPCSPRPTTVDLGLKTAEQREGTVYFPTCTKVERCGGCFPSRHFSCVPEQTEKLHVNVIKAQLPFPGATRFIFSGFEKVIVDRHVTCRLQCDLTPERCGPDKLFLPGQCKCACAEVERCLGNKVWDAERCRCACARERKCCCGKKFNPNSCACEMDLGRQEASNPKHDSISKSEADEYLEKNQQLHKTRPGDIQPERRKNYSQGTGSDRTTISTASKPSRTDACASIRCPPSFTGHLSSNGLCTCRPPASRLYRFRRRYHRQSSRN